MAPAGARVTVFGKETTCDDLCQIKFSRREVNNGKTEIAVTLDWNGRSVRKSIERDLFNPLVTFDVRNEVAPEKQLHCDIPKTANVTIQHANVKIEHGLILHARGALGDTITIGGRQPDEPGEGKDYAFSEEELLGALVFEHHQTIKIVLPLSVESRDGLGWKSSLVCNPDMLASYVKTAQLSAHASSTPTAGALVVGAAWWFVGKGTSPWDARIVAQIDQAAATSRRCSYDGRVVTTHWLAHLIQVRELRTGTLVGAKRFTAKPDSLDCPPVMWFRSNKTDISTDIMPNAEEEASWLLSLVTH
jgi:hypothetical protein